MDYKDLTAQSNAGFLCTVLLLALLADEIIDDLLRFKLELLLEIDCMYVLFLIRQSGMLAEVADYLCLRGYLKDSLKVPLKALSFEIFFEEVHDRK